MWCGEQLTFAPFCSRLTHFFPPLHFSPLSYFPFPLSLPLLLEWWPLNFLPPSRWMAFLPLLKGGGGAVKAPNAIFHLISYFSTYPIYNSASFLADWHSTLLGSQNKCNSRMSGKSRLPGFFCRQAFVRSVAASTGEVPLLHLCFSEPIFRCPGNSFHRGFSSWQISLPDHVSTSLH